MSKRFTDTDKYKKPFVRALPGPYKLLWDYINNDCNFAGIWHVDLEVAQIRIGADMKVSLELALSFFGPEIQVLDKGAKWFIKSFVLEQYGILNEANRVHAAVLSSLKKEGAYMTHISPLQGAKDKDMDKDIKSLKTLGDGVEGEYKTPNANTEPLRAVVWAYKCAKGFDPQDRKWDKRNFARSSKSAKELLDIFDGLALKAASCIVALAERFDSRQLDWKLETIVKHAEEWKIKNGGPNGNVSSERFLRLKPQPRATEEVDSRGSFSTAGEVLNGSRDFKAFSSPFQNGSGTRGVRDERTLGPVAESVVEDETDRGEGS